MEQERDIKAVYTIIAQDLACAITLEVMTRQRGLSGSD